MAPPAGEKLNFTDDLLAATFILLPLADLCRACASCAAFRRVITSPSFIRRLHALRPPSLLGFGTFFGSFRPVDPPHPSAASARALARAADFRFSFLPNPGFWVVRDVRDGRFLVEYGDGVDGTLTTLAVCDPLFRRYVLLPPIPQDLAAAVQQHITTGFAVSIYAPSKHRADVLLAPCGDEEAAAAAAAAVGQPQPFRVIWIANFASKLVVFVFSSASSQWRAISSPSWCDLEPDLRALMHGRCLLPGGYAYGCFYWCLSILSEVFKLLVLDMSTMEFSIINPLSEPSFSFSDFAMVELGESRRGMFLVAQRSGGGLLQLFCANGQSYGDEDASQWVLTKEAPLPWADGHHPRIIGYADGTLLVQGGQEHSSGQFSCMSFDFKTLQSRKVREALVGGEGDRTLPAPYIGYPPSLASPTI